MFSVKKKVMLFILICMAILLAGCSGIFGMGTIQENSPEKYGEWEKYHTAPTFLPERIDEYTINTYSYTLYNYMDTCYEIFLDITVSEEQFNELIEEAKQYTDTYMERETFYSEGYTEIIFADAYKKGETSKYDGLEQVGTAKIDKVIYNPETLHIIYVSFYAEDTGVYDVENIAYFNRFSITTDEYIEHLWEIETDE